MGEIEAPMEEMDLKKKRKKKPLKLRCSVQNYDWGKIGEETQVAKLFSLNSGLEIESNNPYAEFWMGTHESGPSFVVVVDESRGGEEGEISDSDCLRMSLKSWISENPCVLGQRVVDRWGKNLPFLFKVLSVAKALSIQVHPDKESAVRLHKEKPDLYKDDNHKPEMALAISEFEALCGFITLEELKGVIHSVPEVIELVGNEVVEKVLHANVEDGEEEVKSVLKSIFTKLMLASEDAIQEVIPKLKDRLLTEKKVRQLTEKEDLVLLLEEQYSSDIGVISAFFLNFVKLNPGEALYLGANEPHAYISGECIECMATSDNVVRAGLTPKLRDVTTLCDLLTYKQGVPEILQGDPLNPYTRRYTPPFEEFEVDHCILPKGESVVFHAVPGPSIFLVTAGEGTMHVTNPSSSSSSSSSPKDELMLIKEGVVLFVPAETEISLNASTGLQIHRAGVNNRFFLSTTKCA